MDEKRANLRGIAKRVQKRILAPGPVVTPVKRLALAPAAATDDCPSGLRVFSASAFECARLGLCHDVRSVSDELAINAKNGLERAFDLLLCVVLRLQPTHRRFDQFVENGNIFRNSEPETNLRLRHHSKAQPVGEFYRGVLLRSEPQLSNTIFSANAEARATGSARRPA